MLDEVVVIGLPGKMGVGENVDVFLQVSIDSYHFLPAAGSNCKPPSRLPAPAESQYSLAHCLASRPASCSSSVSSAISHPFPCVLCFYRITGTHHAMCQSMWQPSHCLYLSLFALSYFGQCAVKGNAPTASSRHQDVSTPVPCQGLSSTWLWCRRGYNLQKKAVKMGRLALDSRRTPRMTSTSTCPFLSRYFTDVLSIHRIRNGSGY